MVSYKGKRHGPYSLAEVNSMLATGMIDTTAQVWRDGWAAWKTIGSIAVPAESVNTIAYRSPATTRRRSAGPIARYRRRVGHRSFIFQMILLFWTLLYTVWIASASISVAHAIGSWASQTASQLPSIAPPASSAPPASPGSSTPNSNGGLAEILAGILSPVMFYLAGWAIPGLPLLIAAVATMENNRLA